MAEEKGSFWQTIPGILTAATGLLTAVTGLVVALNQMGFLRSSSPPTIANSATPVALASTVGQPHRSPRPRPTNAVAGNDALIGVWLNDQKSAKNGQPESSLTITRLPDGTHILQGLGNCEPKRCDWGTAPLQIAAGGAGSDLNGLHATTKLVHLIASRNKEEVTYLALEGAGKANSMTVHRRLESYIDGKLATTIERSSSYTKSESANAASP